MRPSLSTRDTTALGALVFIVGVTAAWWALALWPVPGEVPGWLLKTRAVCFGATGNGLPAPTGWMVLIGEPFAMVIALMIIAGDAVPSALRSIAAFRPGRIALGGTGVLMLAGLVLAGVRVGRATGLPLVTGSQGTETPVEVLDELPPPLHLTDQVGRQVALDQFRGRAVIVTFAYGHCASVCPIAIHAINEARRLLAGQPPAVLVVTLDPWRDTPARLASIAGQWNLGPDGHVLGGTIEETEATLDHWKVGRTRDAMTGDITHTTPVYLVRPNGRLAYRLTPSAEAIARLLQELGT